MECKVPWVLLLDRFEGHLESVLDVHSMGHT